MIEGCMGPGPYTEWSNFPLMLNTPQTQPWFSIGSIHDLGPPNEAHLISYNYVLY